MIKIKRAYDLAEKEDGYRVLIDRLWPRGIKKSNLMLDEWTAILAPSDQLRKSFGHKLERWKEFKRKYQMELRSPMAQEKIKDLAKLACRSTVTLIYSARDKEHNNAVLLSDVLRRVKNRIQTSAKISRKAA